jgi:ribonuclease J
MQLLRVVPLGGLGEIGKNMMLMEYSNHAIIIDAGLMFPEGDHLGVDYIIPDMGYLKEHHARLNIHAILITHGHEDHIGAIGHVLDVANVPIYATPLTVGLLKVRLRESRHVAAKVNLMRPGDQLRFGPFEVQPFHVCHSIPDCVGFGIRTPIGQLVFTGDFKFDNTPVDGRPPDYQQLAKFGQEGVLALFADSTNADRAGWTPSETVIDAAFDRVFQRAEGRIMVATFASLISRIAQVANSCQRHGRKMAIVGYSMNENIKMAFELQYLNFPRDLIVPIDKALRLPHEQITFIVTGSQGEPSAVLSRLANGKHQHLELYPGDTVVMSAHAIPGNEEVIQRIINRLIQRGAHVITDAVEQVHVSGHASQEEMKLMMNLVKPRFFVPVHGELRHLSAHAQLAVGQGIAFENCAVIENGTILEFTRDEMRVRERYPGGYVFVDGSGVGDVGPAVMRDREILANEGFVVVTVALSKKGKLLKEPRIISRGVVFLGAAEALFENIREAVRRAVTKKKEQGIAGNLETQIEDAVSRVIYQETKRRPMVFADIHHSVAE